MTTIFETTARRTLTDRVSRLSPDARPKWGRFTCPQMLAHLNEAMRMALGELATTPMNSPLRYPGIKQLVIFALPWPKGADTAPELLRRSDAQWESERAAFSMLLDRFDGRASDRDWPVHPIFGTLSPLAWGVLVYRHVDHHFTQFGV